MGSPADPMSMGTDNGLVNTNDASGASLPCSVTVPELQRRLARRNAVLDEIRRAYHHDVIVVKEYLRRLRADGDLPPPARSGPNGEVYDPLLSLPSLDLRPALLLFSPSECELRLRPCNECGGRLEIVHRESSRVSTLRRSVTALQASEQDLRVRIARAEVRTAEAEANLEGARIKAEEDAEVFSHRVSELKRQVEGREEAEEECVRLRRALSKLTAENAGQRKTLLVMDGKCRDLDEATDKIARLSTTVRRRDADVRELTIDRDECGRDNERLRRERDGLLGELTSLRHERSDLEGRCADTSRELSVVRDTNGRLSSALDESRGAAEALEDEIERTERERIEAEEKTERRRARLEGTILELEEEVRRKEESADLYRREVEDITRNLQSQTALADKAKTVGDGLASLNAEVTTLRGATADLSAFAISYARATYDHCVAQEAIVTNEGSDLPMSRLSQSDGGDNCDVAVILERLRRGYGSEGIGWEGVMADGNSRRRILGLLGNRMQMGLFALEKIVEGLHIKREGMKRRLESGRARETAELRRAHDGELTSLRMSLEEAQEDCERNEEQLRAATVQYECAERDVEKFRSDLAVLRDQYSEKRKAIASLNQEVERKGEETEDLNRQVEKVRPRIILTG